MEDKRCDVRECTTDEESKCLRSFPAVHACKLNATNHLDKNCKAHCMTSILVEPIREADLEFFEEKSKSQNDISAVQNLKDKRTEDCNRLNKADLEQESKIACSAFKKNPSVQNSPLIQTSQDNAMTHHQQISLFNLISKDCRTTTLLILNTETENYQEKIIQTPERLDSWSCIAQLPSGQLFCYGKGSPISGITLIIEENGEVQELPYGTPCCLSSAICFSNHVYCFGGYDDYGFLNLSSKFDLARNEWVELAPLPKACFDCNSIIFNGDILISGAFHINLLRYSIGDNSFTTIPYQFAEETRKILINGERLYLIECYYGWIYESEIGSDTAWWRIGDSKVNFNPLQTYCSYNKGEVYIGCLNYSYLSCFRFNLVNKSLMKLP